MPDTPPPEGDRGRILPFRRGQPYRATPPNAEENPPDEGVEKHACAGEPDNSRQRMINNGLALVAWVVLVAIGIWIATTMAEMRKRQDCVLSGRRGWGGVPGAPPRTPEGGLGGGGP